MTKRKSDLAAREYAIIEQARKLASTRLQVLHSSAFRRLLAEAMEEVRSEFARAARDRSAADAPAC